jgi:hypothetical protein
MDRAAGQRRVGALGLPEGGQETRAPADQSIVIATVPPYRTMRPDPRVRIASTGAIAFQKPSIRRPLVVDALKATGRG